MLASQELLSICLQDHWAACNKSGESLNIVDHAAFDNHTSYIGSINGPKLPLVFEVQQKSLDLTTVGCPKINLQSNSILKKASIRKTRDHGEVSCIDKSNPLHKSYIKRYSKKLASTNAEDANKTVVLKQDFFFKHGWSCCGWSIDPNINYYKLQ